MLNPGPLALGSSSTPPRAVLPFYGYAAVCYLAATTMLLFSTPQITLHYFQGSALALTHLMTLGWGTMIILGVSHQLFPVLIEFKLKSVALALASFTTAALGIPLLVYGFFHMNFGGQTFAGGVLVCLAVCIYATNLLLSLRAGGKPGMAARFVMTATAWLLATCLLGLLLIWNMNHPFLPASSISYLPLHAHLGILGWFLMLILGVASRLLPMFLISTQHQFRHLGQVYFWVNAGLLTYVVVFFLPVEQFWSLLPLFMLAWAAGLFLKDIHGAWQTRIRKKVDEPMRLSLLAFFLMILPFLILLILIGWFSQSTLPMERLAVAYGFAIFFGWITALILGMTFKTLPFIIWKRDYQAVAGKVKTPSPKTLFQDTLFRGMAISYLLGFLAFLAGVFGNAVLLMKIGSIGLFLSALFYNGNVWKLILHKPRWS